MWTHVYIIHIYYLPLEVYGHNVRLSWRSAVHHRGGRIDDGMCVCVCMCVYIYIYIIYIYIYYYYIVFKQSPTTDHVSILIMALRMMVLVLRCAMSSPSEIIFEVTDKMSRHGWKVKAKVQDIHSRLRTLTGCSSNRIQSGLLNRERTVSDHWIEAVQMQLNLD